MTRTMSDQRNRTAPRIRTGSSFRPAARRSTVRGEIPSAAATACLVTNRSSGKGGAAVCCFMAMSTCRSAARLSWRAAASSGVASLKFTGARRRQDQFSMPCPEPVRPRQPPPFVGVALQDGGGLRYFLRFTAPAARSGQNPARANRSSRPCQTHSPAVSAATRLVQPQRRCPLTRLGQS